MSMMPPDRARRIDQMLFTQVPGRGGLGRRPSRPHIVPKCNASLSICATEGEEPEIEMALV